MITIHSSKKGTKFVWASDLKLVLEVQSPIESWMKRMISYGFEKNTEYSIHYEKVINENGENDTLKDYAVRIEMAKHIVLVQDSKKVDLFVHTF